jgi:hypothetical protein
MGYPNHHAQARSPRCLRPTNRQPDSPNERPTARPTDRQPDRPTDRPTYRPTDLLAALPECIHSVIHPHAQARSLRCLPNDRPTTDPLRPTMTAGARRLLQQRGDGRLRARTRVDGGGGRALHHVCASWLNVAPVKHEHSLIKHGHFEPCAVPPSAHAKL